MGLQTQSYRDEFLTVKEAAEMLNCSVSTLRRKVRNRKIRFHKIGHSILFSKLDLQMHLAFPPIKQLNYFR